MTTETEQAALTRLRRKIDIMRLDAKSKHDSKLAADASECLALIDILERQNGS